MPLETVQSGYSQAARAFLKQDFVSALDHIEASLAQLPPPVDQDGLASWQRHTLEGRVDLTEEWRRKLAILLVTALATVLCTSNRPQHAYIAQFDQLDADSTASRLFGLACSVYDPAPGQPTSERPLAGPSVARLPPSVAVASALGALKLESPLTAQLLVEAWFASVPEPIELLVESTADAAPAVDAGTSLSDSLTLPRSVSGSVAAIKTPAEQLLASYEKLLDLYALHILPKLDRWQDADEWIRLLARENGGITRQSKVDQLLNSLAQVQAQHIRSIEVKAAREAQIVAAQKQDAERKAAAKAAKRKAKINGRHATSSTASGPASPPKARKEDSVAEYASKRESINGFLSQRDPKKVSAPIASTWQRFMAAFQRLDLVKASSVLAAVFVILAWRRRAGSLREKIGAGLSRVKETVVMGTRTSYL